MYEILPYSYKQAKKLGVRIQPSRRKNKKIDVFDWNGYYICSIGASGYMDYPTFLKSEGKEYADYKRHLYKKRHQKDRMILGSAGYYADNILW